MYVCLSCRTHLSAHDSIISKAFQGRHGRAYLFADVVNINSGPTENRLRLTGLHVVDHVETRAGVAGRQEQQLAEVGRGGPRRPEAAQGGPRRAEAGRGLGLP